MLQPTIGWDYPMEDYISEFRFRTIYSKEFEYSEGKKAKFKVAHNWQTGECVIIAPNWAKRKDFDYYGKVSYKGKDPEKIAMINFANKNKGNRFIGNQISSRGHLPYSRNSHEMGIRTAIGKTVERLCLTVIEGIVVLRHYRFRCHLPKDGETGGFEEYKRIFFKNGTVWAEYPVPFGQKYMWDEKNYKKSLVTSLYMKKDLLHIENKALDALEKEFKGVMFFEPYGLFKFLPTTPQNTAFQKKVSEFDTLVKPLSPDMDLFKGSKKDKECDFPYDCYHGKNKVKTAICEKLNENLIVIRLFFKKSNITYEYARIFLDDKRVYPCYFYKNRSTRCNSLDKKFWDLQSPITLNFFDADTVLKTRFSFLENVNSKCVISKLIFAQKYLFVEQLAKMGFYRLAKNIILDNRTAASFIRTFRNGNFKGLTKLSVKDFFSSYEQKRLLLFKNQITSVSDIENLLFLFNNCKFNGIDIFKYLSENFKDDNIFDTIPYVTRIFKNVGLRCTETQNTSLLKRIIKQIKNIDSVFNVGYTGQRRYCSFSGTVSTLSDTYVMLSNITEDDGDFFTKAIELSKCKNVDEIFEKHDELSSLIKFKEYPQERYDRIKNSYTNIEFADEDFIVRLPESTKEIMDEGNKMHHCVGSYVDDVMNGRSIIMLLRKKSSPNNNYVTIELDRDNCLVQAKCKCNEVISSQKTLSFLTKWIKEKHIRLRTSDLSFKEEKVCIAPNPYVGYYIEPDSVVDKNGKIKASA